MEAPLIPLSVLNFWFFSVAAVMHVVQQAGQGHGEAGVLDRGCGSAADAGAAVGGSEGVAAAVYSTGTAALRRAGTGAWEGVKWPR